MAIQRVSTRAAHFPPGYGEPSSADQLLPWSFVEQRLIAAPNYWVTSASPDGRPHARPVDGTWVNGALCFGGSDRARWVQNLLSNPAVSVNLGSETEAIILEGTAEFVTDAAHPLAVPSTAASREKYPQYYSDADGMPPFRPFWMMRPRVVYAWTLSGFPKGAARWRFAD